MNSILLVDDHQIIRDALKYYFVDLDDYAVKGEAKNGADALKLIDSNTYDIVICDVNMPVMNGIEFMENIRLNYPDLKVLVLSSQEDAGSINRMIALGAHGYILKNAPKEEMISAIESIINGKNYYSKQVYETIIAHIAGTKAKQRLTIDKEISDREKEVLRLIVQELSNQQMADKLFISIRTIEAHKRNLLEKTGCKNIAGLVMYAVERDIF